MQSSNYRAGLLKKINAIRKITFAIMGACIVFIAASSCFLLYHAHKMGASYFSAWLTLFGLFFFLAAVLLLVPFFRKYSDVISNLNGEDTEALRQINESRSWIEKYLPSFIIYSGKIRVFKLYNQQELFFTELAEISIRTNYFSKSRQDRIVIFRKLSGGTYFFGIDGNPAQRTYRLLRVTSGQERRKSTLKRIAWNSGK